MVVRQTVTLRTVHVNTAAGVNSLKMEPYNQSSVNAAGSRTYSDPPLLTLRSTKTLAMVTIIQYPFRLVFYYYTTNATYI